MRGARPVDVGALRLAAGAALRGQVRSLERGLLAGVRVEVADPDRPDIMGGRQPVVTKTDAEGRFAFTNLAPGEVKRKHTWPR